MKTILNKSINDYDELNTIEETNELLKEAKPFLKWVGGKTKLLSEIESRLPEDIKEGKIKTYIEPFIGGGAVFFYMLSKYKFDNLIISDINKELILTYKVIKNNVEELISILEDNDEKYNSLSSLEEKQEFYNSIKNEFNKEKDILNYDAIGENEIKHASFMIFLNKSCFNGLYRENKKGEFNVPFGKKEILNSFNRDNMLSINKALKDVTILNGDFEKVKKYIDKDTFIYMDPPYRPLKDKKSFKNYSKEEFNDDTQIRLNEFCKYINETGAKFMESNSDPKNTDEEDNFFDELYNDFNIERIKAARSVNSKGDGRGKVSEIIIKNY